MKPTSTILSSQSVSKVTASALRPEEFLTTKGLMKLLKIKHRQTIYNLIKEGLPTITVGRNFRFLKNEVIHFLRKNSQSRIKNSW